ncbi:MAG: ABC transporter ATP-binding protein [Actinobacteria bacterium]|nr:ABC transporter ATP-binding protein [Actinomycetota bacterium]
MLAVNNLEVAYGAGIVVLRGASLRVDTGTIVALLGANGAGKSTLLRAVSGLLPIHRGQVVGGTVMLSGERIDQMGAPQIVRRGLAQVMEGRRIFAELSVDENLRAGAYSRRDRGGIQRTYDFVMSMFPVLERRQKSQAGYLSGGEQQMLAIGRALMAQPRLLLLDEPSLGLAPLIVQQIRDIIVQINGTGTSVLLVEQNATMALSIAHHGYVMQNGRIMKEGPADELLADPEIREFYLGVGETGRRSFRDLKVRRRQRWSA